MAGNYTQDFLTSRRNFADGSTRVGDEGRLWYDAVTNTIRVGDGATPGGIATFSGDNPNAISNTSVITGNQANVSLVQFAPTIIDMFNIGQARTAKYVVSVSDFANNRFQGAEVIVTQDGNTAYSSVFGINATGGPSFVRYSADIAPNSSVVTVYANSSALSSYCNFQTIYVPI